MPSTHAKVCIVAISLAKGGAERSTALLSEMLYEEGFEVHIVTLNDAIDYDYAGTLFNLGAFKKDNTTFWGRISRFSKLRNYLKQHKFDYIIDNRNRQFPGKELYYLYYLYRGFKVIYVVRSFKLNQYFPDNQYVAKRMVAKAEKIVGVSKAIAGAVNKKYATTKAVAVYNPVEVFSKTDMPDNTERYILFLGRIEEKVKNLSLLLEGYKLSDLPENNVRLKILGDGSDKKFVADKIKELNLQNYVDQIPFTPEVYPYLKNALFLVLTSRYEGFPRVLIEALSAGTPVVSVDCESGPNEIIIHEKNGLLVENFNPEALAASMNRFIFDEELYQRCKKNSKESVAHLSKEHIAKQWSKLLENE